MQRRTSAPCGCRAAVASAPAKSSRQSRNQSFDGQTLCKVVYFQKANEFAYGLSYLANVNWWYMEMFFRERKSYFFRRNMRSPAFVLIAGFYYELEVGDKVSAENLLALARGRDIELKAIEITTQRGLRQRDRDVLMEKFRRDLGVAWIYKLKQRKRLWATGCILLILLFVIRHIMILIDSGRLLRII